MHGLILTGGWIYTQNREKQNNITPEYNLSSNGFTPFGYTLSILDLEHLNISDCGRLFLDNRINVRAKHNVTRTQIEELARQHSAEITFDSAYTLGTVDYGSEYIFTFSEQFNDYFDLFLLMVEIEASDIVDYAWMSMIN